MSNSEEKNITTNSPSVEDFEELAAPVLREKNDSEMLAGPDFAELGAGLTERRLQTVTYPGARTRDQGKQKGIRQVELAKNKVNQTPALFTALINTALIALALALVMLFLAIPGEAADQTERPRFFDSGSRLGFPLSPGEADGLQPAGAERLIKPGTNRLEVLNVSGGVEYSVVADLQDPVVLNQGDRSFIYDREGLYYCLLGRRGLIFEGRTDWPIQGAVLGEKGHLALLQNIPHSRGSLLVLNSDGEKVLQWTSRRSLDSGYLINVVFGPADRYINLSLLNTDGTSIRPVVKRLALGMGKAGEELLNLRPDLARPFTLMSSLKDGEFWLCDGKNIYVYDESQAQMRLLYRFDRVASMLPYEHGVAVVAAAQKNELGLYYLTGKPADAVEHLPLGNEVGIPKVAGKHLTITTDGKILKLAAADLAHPRELDLSAQALDCGLNASGAVLSVTTDYVLRSER